MSIDTGRQEVTMRAPRRGLQEDWAARAAVAGFSQAIGKLQVQVAHLRGLSVMRQATSDQRAGVLEKALRLRAEFTLLDQQCRRVVDGLPDTVASQARIVDVQRAISTIGQALDQVEGVN